MHSLTCTDEGSSDSDSDNQDNQQAMVLSTTDAVVPSAVATSNAALPCVQTQPQYLTSAEYFGCIRCRARLFCPADATTHALDAVRTVVFKIGEEGLCQTSVFIACEDSIDLASRTRLRVQSGNVECAGCGTKLGRFAHSDAHCACGATVPGPVAKVTRVKIDFFDGMLDAVALAARARVEAEEALYLVDHDANLEIYGINTGKKADRQGKKMLTHQVKNRGNFSDFRNKSFIPNITRKKKGNTDTEQSSTIVVFLEYAYFCV